LLVGAPIDMLSTDYIIDITTGNYYDTEETAKENGGWYYSDREWVESI
jgi:hypothetical protein